MSEELRLAVASQWKASQLTQLNSQLLVQTQNLKLSLAQRDLLIQQLTIQLQKERLLIQIGKSVPQADTQLLLQKLQAYERRISAQTQNFMIQKLSGQVQDLRAEQLVLQREVARLKQLNEQLFFVKKKNMDQLQTVQKQAAIQLFSATYSEKKYAEHLENKVKYEQSKGVDLQTKLKDYRDEADSLRQQLKKQRENNQVLRDIMIQNQNMLDELLGEKELMKERSEGFEVSRRLFEQKQEQYLQNLQQFEQYKNLYQNSLTTSRNQQSYPFSLEELLSALQRLCTNISALLNQQIYHLFERSADHASAKRQNSLNIFLTNLSELKRNRLDGTVILLQCFFLFKGIAKKSSEQKQKSLIKSERVRNQANSRFQLALYEIKEKRRSQAKDVRRNVMFLFRLLVLKYRWNNPVKEQRCRLDADLEERLSSEVVKGLQRWISQN